MGGNMKYILVKQEDFGKLHKNRVAGRSIGDYRFSWDANGLHFTYWDKIIDFFKENDIPCKVVEQ